MPRKARPTTPSMMLGPLGGPNSPPQSPTSAAPMLNLTRKKLASRHLPPYHNITRPALVDDAGIQPTGNGHQFSFTPSNRFAQLSPRTSSEDSDEDEEDEETESEPEVEQGKVQGPRAMPMSEDDDEEDDSDDEEEEDDDDDDDEDSDEDDDDEDVSMSFCPPAPAPRPTRMQAPMPAPRPASMHAPPPPMHAPMHPRMAVDSSSEEDSDDEEDENEDSESEEDSEPEFEVPPPAPEPVRESRTATTTITANFTLEELSDFDPMDQDRSGTIAPSGFSSPASARSRSRAPKKAKAAAHAAELPHGMMRDLRNLNCSASDSESSDDDLDADEAALREFMRAQRELRARKRRSHGSSIGKRTISERSDSDHEDWAPLDPDAVGSSARRLRRRVGDRRSIHLQFQDPPPPRIDELDEPESEVEGVFFCDGETLARELPYWTMEIMEYESPSP